MNIDVMYTYNIVFFSPCTRVNCVNVSARRGACSYRVMILSLTIRIYYVFDFTLLRS